MLTVYSILTSEEEEENRALILHRYLSAYFIYFKIRNIFGDRTRENFKIFDLGINEYFSIQAGADRNVGKHKL